MKLLSVKHLVFCFLVMAFTIGLAAGYSEAGDRVSSACDLISKEKVNEIFGTKFDEAKEAQHRENGDLFMSLCTFNSSDPNSLDSCSVLILYNPSLKDPKVAVEDHIKSFREGIGNPNYAFEPVDNVGGAALYDGAMKQLLVFNEGQMLIFQGFGKDQKKQLIEMAGAVLNK